MELQFKEYASSVSQLKGNNSFFEHFFSLLGTRHCDRHFCCQSKYFTEPNLLSLGIDRQVVL